MMSNNKWDNCPKYSWSRKLLSPAYYFVQNIIAPANYCIQTCL